MSVLSDIVEEKCELEMTPMIDVTFLLLIFFLLTIKFKTLEGKLSAYLPKDVGVNTSEAEERDKCEIRIELVREGTKYVPVRKGQKPYQQKWAPGVFPRFVYGPDRKLAFYVGPKKHDDLDELVVTLEKQHAFDEEMHATIDPRTGVVYGDVVGVLDKAIEAEFKNVTFVGSYED